MQEITSLFFKLFYLFQSPSAGSNSQSSSALGSKTPEKTVMLRSREEGQSSSSTANIPATISTGETTPSHSLQRNPTAAIFSSDSMSKFLLIM